MLLRITARPLVAALALPLVVASPAAADTRGGTRADGAALLRLLGPNAPVALAPASHQVSALVAIPSGQSAQALGVEPVVDGVGRLRGAQSIAAFANAHPGVHLEMAPPVHLLLDKAGSWIGSTLAHLGPNSEGQGVLVGVADTGLDVSHPDLRDPVTGKSRIAWMIDYSLKPCGAYPDIEKKFGATDGTNVVAGCVLRGADIDALLAAGKPAPTDEVGHGTHVTSIAAGNGGAPPATAYIGVAPKAELIVARVTRDSTDAIDNDDLVRGVQFIFDRGDFEKKPIAVNVSLGSDFGPHDGSFLWEKTLASYVGPDKPGHALVVAAGNSGSIVETPIHQSVRVTSGQVVRVPVSTTGSLGGAVQIWVAMRGALLKVGLDGPDGQWIEPIGDGEAKGKNATGYNAGVVNGSTAKDSPVPDGSHGAVVVWSGVWPKGQYAVTLEGDGVADLYLQGTGDVGLGSSHPASFLAGVREGTVTLPATHPSIIAVGCTVNRPEWRTIDKVTETQAVPLLDPVGGKAQPDPTDPTSIGTRAVADGETCWFSSAGPTATGVPKPEIAAPGGIVVAAMSKQALPGSPSSIFTVPCPSKNGIPGGKRCLQIDDTHGVSQGTSMSAPLVTGAVALLFQRDPTLTQDRIVGLLQAGAHRIRGPAPFDDQAGPGELDVPGALDALAQMQQPELLLPAIDKSWITLSADYVTADGSEAVTAILELRAANARRADLFDPTRLRPMVRVNGVDAQAEVTSFTRRGPGVWAYVVKPPPGEGGASMTFGATFDGAEIVQPKTVPIAADVWRAEYPTTVSGGCAAAPRGTHDARALACAVAAAIALRRKKRRA